MQQSLPTTHQQRQMAAAAKRARIERHARAEGRAIDLTREQHDELLDRNPQLLQRLLGDERNGRSWSIRGTTIFCNDLELLAEARQAIADLEPKAEPESPSALEELIEAGANIRVWMCAVIDWHAGDWEIHDEDENEAWIDGTGRLPAALNGFRGSEEEARRELAAQRSFAAARWDAALARVGGAA